MPIFQVAFFKFKPDADPAIIQEWLDLSKTMPAKVPCVRSLKAGKPMGAYEHMAKGWDLAACVELDGPESAKEFHEHPEHERPRELCAQVCQTEQTVSIVFETPA